MSYAAFDASVKVANRPRLTKLDGIGQILVFPTTKQVLFLAKEEGGGENSALAMRALQRVLNRLETTDEEARARIDAARDCIRNQSYPREGARRLADEELSSSSLSDQSNSRTKNARKSNKKLRVAWEPAGSAKREKQLAEFAALFGPTASRESIDAYSRVVKTLERNEFAPVVDFFANRSEHEDRGTLLPLLFENQLSRMYASTPEVADPKVHYVSTFSPPLSPVGYLVDVRPITSGDVSSEANGGLRLVYEATATMSRRTEYAEVELSVVKPIENFSSSVVQKIDRGTFVEGDAVYERCYDKSTWRPRESRAVKKALEKIGGENSLGLNSSSQDCLFEVLFDPSGGNFGVAFPLQRFSDSEVKVGKPRSIHINYDKNLPNVIAIEEAPEDTLYDLADVQVTEAGLMRLSRNQVYLRRLRGRGSRGGARIVKVATEHCVCVQGSLVYECTPNGQFKIRKVDSDGQLTQMSSIDYAGAESRKATGAAYFRFAVIANENEVSLFDTLGGIELIRTVPIRNSTGLAVYRAFASFRYFGAYSGSASKIVIVADVAPQFAAKVDEEDDAESAFGAMDTGAAFVGAQDGAIDDASRKALRRLHLAMLNFYETKNKRMDFTVYDSIDQKYFETYLKSPRPSSALRVAAYNEIKAILEANTGLSQAQYDFCVSEDLYGPVMLHWGVRKTPAVDVVDLVQKRAWGCLTVAGENPFGSAAQILYAKNADGTRSGLFGASRIREQLADDNLLSLALRTRIVPLALKVERIPGTIVSQWFTDASAALSENTHAYLRREAKLLFDKKPEDVDELSDAIKKNGGPIVNDIDYAFYILAEESGRAMEAKKRPALRSAPEAGSPKRRAFPRDDAGSKDQDEGQGVSDDDDEDDGDSSMADIEMSEERSVRNSQQVMKRLEEEKSEAQQANPKRRRRSVIESSESSEDSLSEGFNSENRVQAEKIAVREAVLPNNTRVVCVPQEERIVAVYGDERSLGAVVRLMKKRLKLTYKAMDDAHLLCADGKSTYSPDVAEDNQFKLREAVFEGYPKNGKHKVSELYSQYSENNLYAVLYELKPSNLIQKYRVSVAELNSTGSFKRVLTQKFERLNYTPNTRLVQVNNSGMVILHTKSGVEYFSLAAEQMEESSSSSDGGRNLMSRFSQLAVKRGENRKLLAHLSPTNASGLLTVYRVDKNGVESVKLFASENGVELSGIKTQILEPSELRLRGQGVISFSRSGRMMAFLVQVSQSVLSVVVSPFKKPENVLEVAQFDASVLRGDVSTAILHMDARYVYVSALGSVVYAVMYSRAEDVASSARTADTTSEKRRRIEPNAIDLSAPLVSAGADLISREVQSFDAVVKSLDRRLRGYLGDRPGMRKQRFVIARNLSLNDEQQRVLNSLNDLLLDEEALRVMVAKNAWVLLALACYTFMFQVRRIDEYQLENSLDMDVNEVYDEVGPQRVQNLLKLVYTSPSSNVNSQMIVLASFFQDALDDTDKRRAITHGKLGVDNALRYGIAYDEEGDRTLLPEYVSFTNVRSLSTALADAMIGKYFFELYTELRDTVYYTVVENL